MNVVAFNTKEDGIWDDPEWVKPLDRKAMEKDFEGWVESARQILSLMKKPDIWALFHHPPAPIYYKGRICMLGDAAHASTPHNGAGAGQAVEDALIMSRVMAHVYHPQDIPRAFDAYDQVRRPRSQKQVQTAYENGMLYDLQLEGYMDDWEKVKEKLQSRYRWIWEHELEDDVLEAESLYVQSRQR
jgi:salicylate hydroxylase